MNETKTAILTCLSSGKWRTTPQVAQRCGLSLTNVSELLRRYRGQGLVTRERNYNVSRGYLYRITVVGHERLKYLTATVSQPYPAEIESDAAPIQFDAAPMQTDTTPTHPYTAVSEQIGLSGTKKQIFDQWLESKMGG